MSGGASLEALWQLIDGAFSDAFAVHGDALSCRSGCADCCVGGLTVSDPEAHAIAAWLSSLDSARRERIAELAARDDEAWCVLLDENAACSIYEARPLVCRSFGLPFRIADEQPSDKRRLPVLDGRLRQAKIVDTCRKNFVSVRLEDVDTRAVIDQRSLTEETRRVARAHGSQPDAPGVALVELVRSAIARCPK